MAITFNPSSLTMRVGFRQTVVVTSTTPITSIAVVDARIITVAGATGSTTASVVITPVNGSYGVGKLRIGNSGGELVDLNVTVLGIDTALVSGMIGIASSDFGRLCRGLVGTVQKINKWSKHKPIRYASMQPLDDTIWKNRNYGLGLPSMGVDAIIAYATGSAIDYEDLSTQIKWAYLYPTGGASQPYRIDDFRGYDGGSIPLFDPQRVANPNIYADGTGRLIWTLDVSRLQDQSWGGLRVDDFQNAPGWHLGVMIIDMEAPTGYPVRIIAVNTGTIELYQTIELDITNLPSSTYVAAFFLTYDTIGGGFSGQINNPTSGQLMVDDYDSWVALEDGNVIVGLQTFYPFIIWEARAYPQVNQDIALASSSYYNYYAGAHLPVVDTTKQRLRWDRYTDSFNIQPKTSFVPPYGIIWKLRIPMYIYNPGQWTNNTWYRIVGWYDVDTLPVSLLIKTVLVSGYRQIVCALWDDDLDVIIGSEHEMNVFMPVSSYNELSQETIPQPIMLEVSNYDGNELQRLCVKFGESWFSLQSVNPNSNTPELYFGDGYGHAAPRGLAMEYIDFEAAGRESV